MYTRKGWPKYKEDVQLAARELYSVKDELSEYKGLLIRGCRIVIPFSERKEILDRIHDGHLGVSNCRERARDSVWWPGINQEIKNRVARCRHCLEKQTSQRSEPLIPTPLPERAFQKVGVDLLDFEGTDYLACTDYYSRYIDIVQLPQITSKAVVSALKSVFARHGVPEVVTSDNGT